MKQSLWDQGNVRWKLEHCFLKNSIFNTSVVGSLTLSSNSGIWGDIFLFFRFATVNNNIQVSGLK